MADLHVEQLHFKSFSIIQGTFYSDFPGHAHAMNCYELHYVTDGKGELIVSDKTYTLRKNTVYITGPDIYHMQKTDSEHPMCEYCLFFETEDTSNDPFFNIFLNRKFWIGKSNKKLKKLFNTIYELSQNNTMYHNRQAALLVQLLIFEFVQIYEPQITTLPDNPENNITNDNLITDRFFLYGMGNLTLDALADSLKLSTRQTQRILKKNYGKTFQQKKRDAQMEKAKLLLSKGTSSLQNIAEECGFYGSAAFCNFFKKHTGMTPMQYRNLKTDSDK